MRQNKLIKWFKKGKSSYYQNPLEQLPDRVIPPRPGADQPYTVPETDANPGLTKPLPVAPKYP